MPPRNDLAQGVATGAIGAGFGPYSVRLSSSMRISFGGASDWFGFKSIPSPQQLAMATLLTPLHASVSPHPSGLRSLPKGR